MKLSMKFFVILTTVLLIAVAVMSFYNFPFQWVFYATILGQAFFLIMVYKVLTDDYKTDKTFDDWYEDHPIGKD